MSGARSMPRSESSTRLLGAKDEKPKKKMTDSTDLGTTKFKLARIHLEANQSMRKRVSAFGKHAREFAWDKPDHYEQAHDHFSAFKDILTPRNNSGVLIKFVGQCEEWEGPEKYEKFLKWIHSGPDGRELLIQTHSEHTLMTKAIEEENNGLLEALVKLEDISVRSLYEVKGHDGQPFSAGKRTNVPLATFQEQALRKIIDADPIAGLIRKFCIRNFEKTSDCSKALYKPGNERGIEFDLAGLPGGSISEDFLNTLANHIRFETDLRYVALPKLVVEPSMFHRNKKISSEMVGANSGFRDETCTDLRAVSRWLREQGVRRIMRVTVLDYEGGSHKDTAIKEALENFEIECWDWKKEDICSQVIEHCSKAVKEISLYWTGNYAVMMGWASEEGFHNDEKFPQLKTIRLFNKKSSEDRRVVEQHVERFRVQMARRRQQVTKAEVKCFCSKETQLADTKINGRTPRRQESAAQMSPVLLHPTTFRSVGQTTALKDIEVFGVFDNWDFSHAKKFKSVESESEEGNAWIRSMEKFAVFLQNIPNPGVDPIKIAIIDDGIDATVPELQRSIALGKSFSPYENSTEFIKSYFVPSRQHGTLMATLVRKICPKPRLYIARLEERYGANGQALFTTASAKEAIEWARGCKVDIIVMSWTISSRIPLSQECLELEEEVRKAAKNGILIFTSASDQGENHYENLVPPRSKDTGCIGVGAASDEGHLLSWVSPESTNFTVPARQVVFQNHVTGIRCNETGSSIANACVAGLAGALLYCDRLLGNREDRSPKWKLQDWTSMMSMLKGLSRTSSSKHDPLFIDVHKYLEKSFRDNLGGKQVRIDELLWDLKSQTALEAVLGAAWKSGCREN